MRHIVGKLIRGTLRYFRTYPALLMPGSEHREKMLGGFISPGFYALPFFGISTSVFFTIYTTLERFKPLWVEIKPTSFFSILDARIGAIDLRYVFVEFIHVVILATICYALLFPFRSKVRARTYYAGFLYAYGIAIPVSLLLALTHQALWFDFQPMEQSLVADIPSSIAVIAKNNVITSFIPNSYPIFHNISVSLFYTSNWHETVFVYGIAELGLMIAMYLLRPGWCLSIISVVICSLFSYYTDAIAARYSGKNHGFSYTSFRMSPNIRINQKFAVDENHYKSFALKAGSLAFVDFADCKTTRHTSNFEFVDGRDYQTVEGIHFDPVFTRCDGDGGSYVSLIQPEYEIVRIIAQSGQVVAVDGHGRITVDGQSIANETARQDIKIARAVPDFRGLELSPSPTNEELEKLSALPWMSVEYPAQKIIYTYSTPTDKYDPDRQTYSWECSNGQEEHPFHTLNSGLLCDAAIIDEMLIPEGYYLSMFDNVARPRFMLIRSTNILGRPFLKSIKRW